MRAFLSSILLTLFAVVFELEMITSIDTVYSGPSIYTVIAILTLISMGIVLTVTEKSDSPRV